MAGRQVQRGSGHSFGFGFSLLLSGIAFLGCTDESPAPPDDPAPAASIMDSVRTEPFAVTLQWTSSIEPDFSHYLVQRSAVGLPTFPGSPEAADVPATDPRRAWMDLEVLAEPRDTVWADSLVSPGHQYDYRIVTFDRADQFAESDSVTARTLPAPFPVLGLEPRWAKSDPFVGQVHLWIDGLPDSSIEVSSIRVEFVLPKFGVFSSCDVSDRPLPSWLSLCQVDSPGVSLGWSRLPAGGGLSGGAVLAEIEAQIPLGGEFAPYLVETFGPTGEPVLDTISVRGILPTGEGRPW